MLDEYFQGTLPQLIERARLLKSKIPRNLPRDYAPLIQSCETELDNVIAQFRILCALPATGHTALHHARLRQFKRAVADLEHLETTAIAALNRAHTDDHHANRLLYKICQEIRYPALVPTVSTLSSGYFYIDTKTNLMFIPPAEASFLLHLPDLYHELCHPLLTHRDHPVLDRFRARYLGCMEKVHDHFAEQRDKQALRRGPSEFKDQINLWERLWSKYWRAEFFCDLYAASTLGPAFGWSHLHLYMKLGGNAFVLPDSLRNISHPADAARMKAILQTLWRSGFEREAASIAARWQEALRLTTDPSPPDYAHCYPDELIAFIVDRVARGVAEMDCRLAKPETNDPVHLLLNKAWRTFWADPGGYQQWEVAAVRELFAFCEGKIVALPLASS